MVKWWLDLGCIPFCHPTGTSSFHIIVPTSAYPGRYPRRWLFRQSCFPAACGLDTCSPYRPPMRAHRKVIPFQRSVLRCRRPVLSTGPCMGEHAVNPKDCTHGDGVIAVTTFLVKPVILRRLGPVNDGSNVHSSPGHSNWLEELCMRLTFLSLMLPRFARLMSSRTSGGMLSALTSRVGNFALHQNVSYRVTLG